jgi:SAM-dependent methyltransferase
MKSMSPEDLLLWLRSLLPEVRDSALESYWGIDQPATSAPPGEHLIGYHASGVAAAVRALYEVPVGPRDTVLDLGAGLGKFAMLARLLTGATVQGIEIQPALVERARSAAQRLGLNVEFRLGDARQADFGEANVFYLYAPFSGLALRAVLARLEEHAKRRAIVVCALGVDLARDAPWLIARRLDSFWLELYDSRMPGIAPRPAPSPWPSPLGELARAIADESA